MSNHKSYLFLFNVSKKSNFGFLIRTANAFGAGIILIGRKKYSSLGAVGGTRRTPVHHFFSLSEGVDFVRESGCKVVGVEIMPQARSICDDPFSGSTAFMIGNEGTGLEPWQADLCDGFVYVPQFGTAVSLNVNVATAICLHRFAEWAQFSECPKIGNQFVSDESIPEMHRRYQVEARERSPKADTT